MNSGILREMCNVSCPYILNVRNLLQVLRIAGPACASHAYPKPVTGGLPAGNWLDDERVLLKDGPDVAHAQMLRICRKALPGWGSVCLGDLQISTVSGGITNINAKMAPKSELGLAPVMFKVFGDSTDLVIDRASERIVVTALGAKGFGPKILALFNNGRIEEWLDAITLTPEDMSSTQYVPRIARQLSKFHQLQLDLPCKAPNTPWAVIADWLGQAKQLKFKDPQKQAAYNQIDFAALGQHVQQIAAACSLTQSPVVFGHNDLLSGNILILQQPGFDPQNPDTNGPICFIDYEYGAYTYRGFDIGNHFTEYAGFEGDYTRYPNKEQQELFWRHYLAADNSGAATDAPVEPGLLDRLAAEANVWALASHLYWGIWALVQACYSPIDFDYIQFSKTRLGEMQRKKDEYLAEAWRVFGTERQSGSGGQAANQQQKQEAGAAAEDSLCFS